jgi:hypothetical protein
MPTTFNVISLGNVADMDTVEGGVTAENASALVGMTFGGVGNALADDFVTFSPGTGGFSGGSSTLYDQDNSPAENFRINGGADQVFDSTAVFNATITYTDGTTATITAVLFQDTAGNTYLAPEFAAGPDQTALEAKAIRSLTLNSLSDNTWGGLTANRETWDFVTCFTTGTMILTPGGEVAVETLKPGDKVVTRNHGSQPIRWIGASPAKARGAFAPVRIRAGALGPNCPERDLVLSRQHRIMLSAEAARRMFGKREVLVPAVGLLGQDGVTLEETGADVVYYHILLDRHEVILADGTPCETLLTGEGARKAMGPEALHEIETLFPGLIDRASRPALPMVRGKRLRQLLARLAQNGKPLTVAA